MFSLKDGYAVGPFMLWGLSNQGIVPKYQKRLLCKCDILASHKIQRCPVIRSGSGHPELSGLLGLVEYPSCGKAFLRQQADQIVQIWIVDGLTRH